MSAASSTGSSENPKNGPPFRDVYVITGPLFLPSREEEAGGGSNGSDGEFNSGHFELSLNIIEFAFSCLACLKPTLSWSIILE